MAGLVDRCIIPDNSLGPIDMQTGQISTRYSSYQGIFANHLAAQFAAHGYNYDAFRAGEVPFTLVATGRKFVAEETGAAVLHFDVHFAPGNHYDEWVNPNEWYLGGRDFWLQPYLDSPLFMLACSFDGSDLDEQPDEMPDDGASFILSQRFYVGDELPSRSLYMSDPSGLDSLLVYVKTFAEDEIYTGIVEADADLGCTSENCETFQAQLSDHIMTDAVNQFSERIYRGMDWLDELTGLASEDFPDAENGNTGSLFGSYFDNDFNVSNQIVLYCHDGACYQNGGE